MPPKAPPHIMRGPLSQDSHKVHFIAFVVFEKVPLRQEAQRRSDEALGAATSYSPGLHVAARPNGCISESMQKWFSGHASHVPLLLLPYVPWPQMLPHALAATVLNMPHGQPRHGAELIPLLNCPAAQGKQVACSTPAAE